MTTLSHAIVNSTFVPVRNQKENCDFNQAQFRGRVGKIWATVTGRSNHILDVETIKAGRSLCRSRYVGPTTVDIRHIKGSEGRCQDFDQNFNPLKSHNRDRWTSISNAYRQGVSLPAVDLIKIGDNYIVRDGHHRISVAKFMGIDFIDAHVTEWILDD